jgi:hypothetical protein
VRTRRAIEGRLALDLLRESQADGRAGTTKVLHKASVYRYLTKTATSPSATTG